MEIKTILHPTDFSDSAKAAYTLACSLARDHGARVVVLHVRVPPVIVTEPGIVAEFDDDPEPVLNRLKETHPAEDNLSLDYQTCEGDPPGEILRVASELGADLIVMGTHGRTGVWRVIVGSVAEEVLREAPCPVLTVKSPPAGEEAEAK